MGTLPLQLLLLHLLLLAARAPTARAWGVHGHYMVCNIAEKSLTKKAAAAVAELLPESAGGELGAVCSWADDVRRQYPWSAALHFVDTPGVCNYDYARDCHSTRGEKGMCIVAAIKNYTAQLLRFRSGGHLQPFAAAPAPAGGEYNLTESLMFLAHFVGDIHQPLHAGFEADAGGNTIYVDWYQTRDRLHHVWDDDIIDTAMEKLYGNDVSTMIQAIDASITNEWGEDEVKQWETCDDEAATLTCPDKYAAESVRLACEYAYKDAEPFSSLGDEYLYSRLPVVDKRIAQGGVRLAKLLNGIFGRLDREEEKLKSFC